MELKTSRLILGELETTDLNHIHQLHSLPEVDRYNTLGIPKSINDTKLLLNLWLEYKEVIPRENYIFKLISQDSGNFMGLIALKLGKVNYRIAEVWYKTHPDYWYNGFTSEALKALLFFAFKELKLHRIEAGCAIDNIGSIKVLEKAGMLREGQHRKILPIRGEWVDNYSYAILEEEFIG